MCEEGSDEVDLVHHVKRSYKKKEKKKTVSEGDDFVDNENSNLQNSVEMEEDNFIPEVYIYNIHSWPLSILME